MRVLLDTKALIWWLKDSPRLGARDRALIEDPKVTVMVSIVSLWEITIKWRIGKLEYSGTSLLGSLSDLGISLLPVTSMHLIAIDPLTFHYRDPFDHLIIAQAKAEGAEIVTSDDDMPLYSVPCISAVR